MIVYTLQETADILKVSVKKIRALVSNNKIPYVKIGGETRILEDDLREWLAQNQYKQIILTGEDYNAKLQSNRVQD